MRYKTIFVSYMAILTLMSCNNASNSNKETVDDSRPNTVEKSHSTEFPSDKLVEGQSYRTNKGIDIVCVNNSEYSASLATEDWLSEDDIQQFIKDKEIRQDKNLTFKYKDVNIDFYASVVDGIVKYNDDIPQNLDAAKVYKKKLDEKAKREQFEKERLAKLEAEKNKKIVVGKWLNSGYRVCIYKQHGKFYLGTIKGDNNDEITELYEITRVSSRRYENRDNGDMPERFDILSNGDIRTTVYNPDAPGGGRWVYMGTWMSLN